MEETYLGGLLGPTKSLAGCHWQIITTDSTVQVLRLETGSAVEPQKDCVY